VDSIENILKSKEFAKCNSCHRICRPWHLGTNYIEVGGGFRHTQGYCPYCKGIDYTINEYSDIDMETIQDIIDIKLLENKIKH
jgi:hypothetical protein